MTFSDKNTLIRTLCVALVTTVLLLAVLLLVAVCGDFAGDGTPEETTRRPFRPSLEDVTLDPEDISVDWNPDSSGNGGDTGTLPPEPDVTLPDWEGGFEWPTLPPSLETDPDFELPTLPEGWDTLPPEWDTLPAEWGDLPLDPDDLPYGPEDLADLLTGMNGNIGMPPGALAAGIASRLTVMEIYAEKTDTLYLMMQAFGDYTGQGWDEANAYGPAINGAGYSALYMPHYLMNEITPFTGYPLSITPKMDVRVIPYYVVAEADLSRLQPSDVQAMGTTDRPYTLHYRPYGTHAYASLVEYSLAEYEAAYADFVRRNYLYVDDTTMAYMKLIIEEQGFDPGDPDIVQKVATYIQNAATYNLAYNQNLDKEPNVALAFLGAYKEGVCRHYATAATLLYRALGIPARYTVGFMADVEAGETTAVKGMDAHAWVEVYEEGFGWRYVEVTGSAPGGAPGPGTETGTGTGGGTLPPVEPDTTFDETGVDTPAPTDPVDDPATWGDLMAGVKGGLASSSSIPPSMYENTVFWVTSDVEDRLLLKLKSFGDYTGTGFAPGIPCGQLLYETYSVAYLPGLYYSVQQKYPTHSVRLDSPMGTYAVPYFVTPTSPPPVTVSDLRVTGDGRYPYSVDYYSVPPSYQSVIPPIVNESDFRSEAYEHYLFVDAETAAYLSTLIAQQGWQGGDPGVIEAVAVYLRVLYPTLPANRYDTALDEASNTVVTFLENPTAVTPRHLAAAATLIYRMLGIPARYTVGYLANTETGSTVNVTGEDAYAWVEVYVNNLGWAPVDVANRTPQNISAVTLKPENMAVRYTGESVSHSGVLEGFEEFEALGYTYKATVSGIRSSCGHTVTTIQGISIYDPQGTDVTHLFDITTRAGDLFVYLEELWFSSDSRSQVYDGTPLTTEGIHMVAGTLPEGYSLTVTPTGSQTAVGRVYAAFEVRVWYDSGDGNRVDRTANYFLIRKAYGTLSVTHAELTLKAADAEKVMDGEPLTANVLEIVEGSLADGDSIVYYSVEGSRTTIGRSQNVITAVTIHNKDGEDVTRCYAIDTLPGTLRVIAP
ncbi:MAG: hypothetical protein IJD38_12750 [Clostridia bacterium]|nr:hypothetical protein [Clostridia bacterium]